MHADMQNDKETLTINLQIYQIQKENSCPSSMECLMVYLSCLVF